MNKFVYLIIFPTFASLTILLNNKDNMKEEEINTEQAILKAAEREFFTKGFAGSKTTEIAKAAGVTHAMLHYYFRTKENLFNKVFQEKSALLAYSFRSLVDDDLPFFDKIKAGIELHFDILAQNPKLPLFIFKEILGNEQREDTCREVILPNISVTLEKITEAVEKEIEKGTIRPVNPIDLMMSIISLNMFVFVAEPMIKLIINGGDAQYKALLERRKKENVEIILSRLRP